MYTRTAFPYETTHEDIWIPPADGTRLYAGRGTRPRRPAVGPRARRPGDVTRHPGEAPGDGGPVHPYVAVAPGPGPVRGRRRRPLGRLRDPCGRPGGGRLARPAARLGTTPDPEPPSGPGDVGSPLPRSYGMDAHPPATTCASLPRLPGGRHRLVLPLGHPRLVTPGAYALRGAPVLVRSPQHTGVDAGRFRLAGGDADLSPDHREGRARVTAPGVRRGPRRRLDLGHSGCPAHVSARPP